MVGTTKTVKASMCLEYFLFVFYSPCLYNLYKMKGLPSIHDTNTLHQWLRRLGQELGVDFRFFTAMMTRLYKRTSHVVTTVKCLHHGRQRDAYLDKEWCMKLSPEDVKSKQEVALKTKLHTAVLEKDKLAKENAVLKDTNTNLKGQVTYLADQLQKAQGRGFQAS